MSTFSLDYFDIATLVKTKQDAASLTSILTELVTSLYSVKESVEHILDHYFSYEDKKNLLMILTKNKIDTTNPTLLKEFFIFLKEYLEGLPVATLYVAFVPHTETVETLSEWFYVTLKKEVLLDIHVDKSILGGAIISYRGLYKDYSLRKLIGQTYGQTSAIPQNPPHQ